MGAFVNAAIAVSFLAIGIRAVTYSLRRARHLPPAPDNQPPTDSNALATCRHIARQPLADPDINRTANRYLREKGDETP